MWSYHFLLLTVIIAELSCLIVTFANILFKTMIVFKNNKIVAKQYIQINWKALLLAIDKQGFCLRAPSYLPCLVRIKLKGLVRF